VYDPSLYNCLGRAFGGPSLARPLASRPLRVARDLGWCEYDYPRWGGHFPMDKRNFLRAPHAGFCHGSELSRYEAPALRFATVLCCRGFLMYKLAWCT
jgi:hypothetical protein